MFRPAITSARSGLASATFSLIVFVGYASLSHGATITSTFDPGLEGWTIDSNLTGFSHVALGGNPGGHALATPFTNSALSIASAPSAFLGDLSAFDGGTISFDSAVFFQILVDPNPSFGLIQISDGVSTVSQDIAPTSPISTWSTYSGPFTAAAFGTSEASWSTILSNVTSVTVRLNGNNQTANGVSYGLDNFTIAAVPEPSTFVLAALGALAAAMAARRQQRVHSVLADRD